MESHREYCISLCISSEVVPARRAWSCHLAECDVITRGDEDYSCQETSCQDKLSRLQLSRGRPRQSVSKFAEAKADDDADTERLPPEPPKIPTAATPTRATISDQECVHGWTTPRQRSYLHAIASAQGSASQLQKIVHGNLSQIVA